MASQLRRAEDGLDTFYSTGAASQLCRFTSVLLLSLVLSPILAMIKPQLYQHGSGARLGMRIASLPQACFRFVISLTAVCRREDSVTDLIHPMRVRYIPRSMKA